MIRFGTRRKEGFWEFGITVFPKSLWLNCGPWTLMTDWGPRRVRTK